MAAYTDGSWATTHTLSSFLLNSGEVKSAGAIVLLTLFGLLTIRVDIDIDHASAFVPEVLSLLIAHEILKGRSISIWSDCEAVVVVLAHLRKSSLAGKKIKTSISRRFVLILSGSTHLICGRRKRRATFLRIRWLEGLCRQRWSLKPVIG